MLKGTVISRKPGSVVVRVYDPALGGVLSYNVRCPVNVTPHPGMLAVFDERATGGPLLVRVDKP